MTNHNNISIKEFHEYIEVCLPSSLSGQEDSNSFTKYHINPLLKISDNKVQLKYDVICLLLKVRYIQNCIENNDYKSEIIKLTATNHYGTGSIIEELLLPQNSNSISIKNLSELITFLKKELNKSESKEEKDLVRKSISFTIHLAFKLENPHDKDDRSDLITRLFQGQLSNIYIYGSFHPLNYNKLKISNSQFIGYDSLFQSSFPPNETVFYYTTFTDLQINNNTIIPKTVFDDSCSIPIELRNYFAASKETIKKHYMLIKLDLKKFFKGFATSNVFKECSLNRMNSTFLTKFNRKIFIDEMIRNNIMNQRVHKGNTLYSIDNNLQQSVLCLINQNNLDPKMEAFCNLLMAKYYKI